MRQRNTETGNDQTLDISCSAEDVEQLRFIEKFGFVREPIRSLEYSRSLAEPIEEFPFPPGFSFRSVTGENEVKALVALHRAAFGTDNMTVEERLAIIARAAIRPRPRSGRGRTKQGPVRVLHLRI